MRFTIERMRTLVVAAGALLVVALVAFLAVGRIKSHLNIRELPKRLGVEHPAGSQWRHLLPCPGCALAIQDSCLEGRAAQRRPYSAAQRKNRTIRTGRDRSIASRATNSITTQKSGMAVATGPVEITLMCPAVAPASPRKQRGKVVKKAISGKWSSERRQPRRGPRGDQRAKFDQDTGVTTTASAWISR